MESLTIVQRAKLRTTALWAATKLGWAIEANWADPFVFLVYQIVRPLFGAGILVVMFRVVTGEPTSAIGMAQLYVGNAFFFMVMLSLENTGMVVFMDRERFQMIRYVYLAPLGFGQYLAARGLSQIVALATAVVVTLLFGLFVFGMPLSLSFGEVPYFVAVLLCGLVATMALGVMLASVTMVTAFHGFAIPAGVGGLLFLLSGAVFTIDILPGWVSSISRVLPWTYWLEGLRRTLLNAPFVESLNGMSNGMVLTRLLIATVVTVMVAWMVLRLCCWRALASGCLDQRTDH